MTRWREITFSVDESDSAGTDPDRAETDPKNAKIVIEDERADVLTDPLRLRVLEILGKGKTVTEISETLDVTDARVLYHVRRLAETGIVTFEDAGDDRRNWRCVPVAPVVRFRVEPGDANRGEVATPGEGTGPGDEAPTADPASTVDPASTADPAIPADVAGQFNQAFREAAEGMFGPSFQASVNHNRARLSEAQAAEFNRRLLALIEEYFPPGKGDRSGIKYGFHGVLTPIDLHPLEEAGTGE